MSQSSMPKGPSSGPDLEGDHLLGSSGVQQDAASRKRALYRNASMIGAFGVLFIFLIVMTATHNGSSPEDVEQTSHPGESEHEDKSHNHMSASSPAPSQQGMPSSPAPHSSPATSQTASLHSPMPAPLTSPSTPSPTASPSLPISAAAPVPAPNPPPARPSLSKRARLVAFLAAAKKVSQRSLYQQACPPSIRKENVLACVVVNSMAVNGTAQPYLYVLPATNVSMSSTAGACSANITSDASMQAKMRAASFHSQQEWDTVIKFFADAIKAATYRQALNYLQDRLTQFSDSTNTLTDLPVSSSPSYPADQPTRAAFDALWNNLMNDNNTSVQDVLNAPVLFKLRVPLFLNHTDMNTSSTPEAQWQWQWTDGTPVDWAVFGDTGMWQPGTYFKLPTGPTSSTSLPTVFYSSDLGSWQPVTQSANDAATIAGFYLPCREPL